jgi:hypothetical protein
MSNLNPSRKMAVRPRAGWFFALFMLFGMPAALIPALLMLVMAGGATASAQVVTNSAITKLANGDILIQFSGGVTGALYAVEQSGNLQTWTVAATDSADALGSFSFEDTATAGVSTRFYRAVRAYTVGGTMTGVPAGDTITLQDNRSDSLTLGNGTFAFPTALPDGHAYSVIVSGVWFGGLTPTTCTISNGSGTISGANVTNVAAQCAYDPTTCPVRTGNPDVDMLNAAVQDGTANGGVPGVMYTENGGPFLVTARSDCTHSVALFYPGWARFTTIVAPGSCSSTTFPVGTPVIQFGTAFVCQPDDIWGY